MSTSLKPRIGTRDVKIGTFVFEFATPGIGQILKAAGADYAVLDMEHSAFGFDTVRACIQFMRAGELPVIVRVPSKAYDHLARAMDAGADGVMVPMVGSVAQARAVLDAVKYHPQGKRGVALGMAADRFADGGGSLPERFARHNARTIVMLQIEDPAGADAADEMAAMDGVDVLWVGHNDLSVALGKPGAFDDAAFVAAERKAIDAARRHGKSAGRLAVDAAQARTFAAMGYDFVSIATDIGLLQGALREGIRVVRGG